MIIFSKSSEEFVLVPQLLGFFGCVGCYSGGGEGSVEVNG